MPPLKIDLFRNPEPFVKGDLDGRKPVDRPRTALGLSKGHISPEHAIFTEFEGAGLATLKESRPSSFLPSASEDRPERPKRGKITVFSRSAQARMKRNMAKIPDADYQRSLLITLTYPEFFPAPEDSGTYKRHLDLFFKRLERKFPETAAIWRLEFQKRGAAHYHFILFGCTKEDKVPESVRVVFQEWIAKAWYEVVKSGDLKHLKAGTSTEIPRSSSRARNYVCKYISKNDLDGMAAHTGRHWGRFNRKNLPEVFETDHLISARQGTLVNRVMRKLIAVNMKTAAWQRLKKFHTTRLSGLKSWTLPEFRAACEHVTRNRSKILGELRQGEVADSVSYSGMSVCSFYLLMLLEDSTFPKPWRFRQNATTNIYTNSSEFWRVIQNHPEWDNNQKYESIQSGHSEESFDGCKNRNLDQSRSGVRILGGASERKPDHVRGIKTRRGCGSVQSLGKRVMARGGRGGRNRVGILGHGNGGHGNGSDHQSQFRRYSINPELRKFRPREVVKTPHQWPEEILFTDDAKETKTYALPNWGETRSEFRTRTDPF